MAFLVLSAGIIGYLGYKSFFAPNISIANQKSKVIFIPTGSNFEEVVTILAKENILINKTSFTLTAKLKKYNLSIKPGRYRILANSNNNKIINLLRSGKQEPITITFSNLRTKKEFVTRICKRIEADSLELMALLNNDPYLKNNFGMGSEKIMTLFIPNTYEFKWNTSSQQFMERMKKEYNLFWTKEKLNKAKAIHLTPVEVAILASIVQCEQQQFADERPIIAQLYLNRLKAGIPLQSDPTVIYALGDFTITRVLDIDKRTNSPYNTYLHSGLPPGPIYIPEISSINAVLNAKTNKYIYMCAKEDFSGRHNFASTLAEHTLNAKHYQKALNKQKIWR